MSKFTDISVDCFHGIYFIDTTMMSGIYGRDLCARGFCPLFIVYAIEKLLFLNGHENESIFMFIQ